MPFRENQSRKIRKPVLPEGETGFLGYEGESLLELVFEVLSDRKFYRFGGFDFKGLLGLGIDSHPGFAMDDLERPESDQLDGLAFLQAGPDCSHHRLDRAHRLGLAGREGFLNRAD